jgi:DNA-directed RNA polymerase subunit H
MKILGEKDKDKLLKKYGITEKDLPIMLADDPASQALDAKPGDVVEIHREDPTGPNLYYRLVTE